MALFTTEIEKELLGVNSSSICRTIFKEKTNWFKLFKVFIARFYGISRFTNYWYFCCYYLWFSLDSLSLHICLLELLNFKFMFILIAFKIRLLLRFNSRFNGCRTLIHWIHRRFIPLCTCVISGHRKLLSCNCWVDLNHSAVTLFLT